MAENELDPTKLSFSQAQGYEPLPQRLKLEELSRKARVRFWNVLYEQVRAEVNNGSYGPYLSGFVWNRLLRSAHINFFDNPSDEWNSRFGKFKSIYKPFFLESSFHEVFDLLIFLMRQRGCPQGFVREVGKAFRDCRLAYILDESYPPTIYPAATPQVGEAIIESSKRLRETGLGVAQKHLAEAAEFINNRNWKASIQESIHAVESVAREIADSGGKKSEKALGKALDSLKHKGILQNADLIRAFKQFYAYTSKPGIRHGRSAEEPPNVGLDEAVFMLGACASFASYLCRKQQALPGEGGA